jgi:hypothetical protein
VLVVTRLLPRRSLLIAFSLAGLMLLMPLAAVADGAGLDPAAQADSLWNQPQGTRPDSAMYVIQVWWDGLTRAAARDPQQRGLQELSQANSDLLNAYSLLEEQRADPGPHPVAFIDPLLSGAYGFVTGVHVKAPIGSLLGWVNDSLLHLEGRGTTETIVRSLLSDYQVQRAAASRDLAPRGGDPVWSANSTRETAMLQKIDALATPSLGVPELLAATAPVGTSSPTGPGSDGGKAIGKASAPGQAGNQHGKSAGHQPETH